MTNMPRRAMTCAFMPDGSTFNGKSNILPRWYLDQLKVGDDRAHHDARQQARMQIGLGKACQKAGAHLCMATGQQLTMQGELLGVGRIGGQQRVNILGVVGVELLLNDFFHHQNCHWPVFTTQIPSSAFVTACATTAVQSLPVRRYSQA